MEDPAVGVVDRDQHLIHVGMLDQALAKLPAARLFAQIGREIDVEVMLQCTLSALGDTKHVAYGAACAIGSDQVIDEFPGRKIYVGKKEGNKLENITVFEMNPAALPVRVTFARAGMLEADLPNKRILMHLYDARYSQRDEKNPLDLRKIHDGINMAEGTLPIGVQLIAAPWREDVLFRAAAALERAGICTAPVAPAFIS